ncbi:MAG: L-2-amino-thiazoline-4-carboxylic acid hydrolase [Candidatus Hodarchaeota archaeon]
MLVILSDVSDVEVRKLYYYNPDKKRTINIYQFVKSSLQTLDKFLVYISENKPRILNKFISTLEMKYRSEGLKAPSKIELFEISQVNVDAKLLNNFPGLLEACRDFVLGILDIPKDNDWNSENIELYAINITKASQLHMYHRVKVLTEIIEREEAIDLVKNYIDQAISNREHGQKYEDLASILNSHIVDAEKYEQGDRLVASVENGRYIFRVDRCALQEALKETNDPELSYIVACYGDYTVFKYINENFVLTRTQTLMNGSYCDSCIHDTRIVEKIEHPTKEFYDSLDRLVT